LMCSVFYFCLAGFEVLLGLPVAITSLVVWCGEVLFYVLEQALELYYLFYVTLPQFFESLYFDPIGSCWSVFLSWKAAFVAKVHCDAPQTLFFVWQMPQTRYCVLYNTFYEVSPELSSVDLMIIIGGLSCTLCVSLYVIFRVYVILYGMGQEYNIQHMCNVWLSWFEERPDVNSTFMRSSFADTELGKLRPREGHDHGRSAADRSLVSLFIDRYALSVGLTPYFVQCSNADLRKQRAGCRVAFWAKDCQVPVAQFQLPERSLLAFIDVDQYVDMPYLLTKLFRPTVVFTFQPDSVAKIAAEYNYTFNADNQVTYRVSGGAVYTHLVWNYSVDNIFTCTTVMGIPIRVAIFLIDRRETSPDHQMILLTPIKRWTGLIASIPRLVLTGTTLNRLNVACGSFTRLLISKKDGLYVSTGRPGEHATANISKAVDETISTIARTSKYPLNMAQTQSMAEGRKEDAALLLAYHQAKATSQPDVVFPVCDGVRRYQFDPENHDPNYKPGMTAFMSPIIHGAFVPDNCKSSEEVAVLERVVKTQPPLLPISPFLAKCMKEFVEFLIPTPQQLDPVDEDYLYNKQARPTQRRILDTRAGLEPDRTVKSFLKKEPYGDVKAPRIISTINGVDKASYSQYMYAYVDNILKHQKWYAFGKSPAEIAERVAEICQEAVNHVVNSDYSKYDGHGSNVMREFERIKLMRAFRAEHHAQLADLHSAQFNRRGYTPHEIAYDTGYSRLSGSPETSPSNTDFNAFISYVEARISNLSPLEAWNSLGIFGGDDGLGKDVDPLSFQRAAKMVGQVVTVEPILRGSIGVKFLARIYSPFVWMGDVNSCCDIKRQAAKLHVTPHLPTNVTPLMKLLEKCRCLYLTDQHTPILGAFAERAVFLYNSEIEPSEETARIRTWGSMYPKEKQYPNLPADWMMDYCESVLPGANFERFMEWLRKTTGLEELLQPPLLLEPALPTSDIPVVVDGDIVGDQPKLAEPPKAKRSPPPTQKAPPPPIREDFDTMKARKIKAGTWIEKDNPRASASKADFETMKAKKVAAGTWIEKTNATPKRSAAGRKP